MVVVKVARHQVAPIRFQRLIVADIRAISPQFEQGPLFGYITRMDDIAD